MGYKRIRKKFEDKPSYHSEDITKAITKAIIDAYYPLYELLVCKKEEKFGEKKKENNE